MKFKNIYYIIWSDIIVRYRIKEANLNDKELKFNLLFLISSINAINIWVVFFLMKILNIYEFESLKFYILPTERLNNGITFFIQYVLPCIIINYFFIFRNKRYLNLIERYSTPKNNYGNIYISIVLFFTFLIVIIDGIITGDIIKF